MNSSRNTVVRSLHDVGAAGWFGGSLMGAVALNGASKDVSDPAERSKIAASGWGRWAPFAAAAIGAHLLGGGGLLLAHRDRIRSQPGVGANTAVKTVLTLAALGTTAYSGLLGAKLGNADGIKTEGGTVPAENTPMMSPGSSSGSGSCSGPPPSSPAPSSCSAPSRASRSAPASGSAAGGKTQADPRPLVVSTACSGRAAPSRTGTG